MRCPPRALNLVMDAVNAVPPGAVSCDRGPLVAEISPLTNRVRTHFARIKAVRGDRGQSWLLCKSTVGRRLALPRTFEGETQADSARKVRTFPRGKSGHVKGRSGNVGAVGRGDQAAHHSTSDFGLNTRTTGGFGLDHPPGAAIGHQGREHRMVELVAAAHRAIGAE